MLVVAAILASVAVIYVSSDDEMKDLIVIRGSGWSVRAAPWISGKHWALDVFLIDADQAPHVRAVVNGKARVCQTDYLASPELHITTVHIPAEGPCQVANTKIP